MNTVEEITLRIFFSQWKEFLSILAADFAEKHLVLRAIRIRTACTSPLYRRRRARERRRVEAKLRSIKRQLEQIADQRANDFIAEGLLHAEQAILQSDLLNL